MPLTRYLCWITLTLVLAVTIFVYAPGLNGPFLFDDHIHITQNRWVQIDSLDWPSLIQAWHSSFSEFPSNRPLAQLSFGVTHALAGLDPRAFKTVNLVIHLLNGLMIYFFVHLAHRAVHGNESNAGTAKLLALVVAAFWLLHPMHVSTVLYAVQRMAQLSTLTLLLALCAYVWGRLQISRDRAGAAWMLAAAPLAGIGFLFKENAVLMPLLLLSVELSLLTGLSTGKRKRFVHGVWIICIGLPLAVGLAYLATHPGLLSYENRPFSLEERLLTQPRVLWTYLRWLLAPDLPAFGLFHDDLIVSRGWLSPPTTLLASIALISAFVAGLVYRRKAPVFAFAVLFYLASHALESSFFPLEMMFEHRNYLASVGPLYLLGHLIVVESHRLRLRAIALALGALLLISHGVATFIRVDNWTSYQKFVMSAAENHPQSRRSNFMAAQLLITAIGESDGDITPLATAAEHYLDNGLQIGGHCLDCLFGKIALSLHLNRQPARAVVERLIEGLKTGDVSPTQVAVSQFSFLARWHEQAGFEGTRPDVEAIFDAALQNPGWNYTGRASIEAAYRQYHEHVTGDLAAAERHARAAIAAWPDQWGYHKHLLRILRRQGRLDDALNALQDAAKVVRNAHQRQELHDLNLAIRNELQAGPNGHN